MMEEIFWHYIGEALYMLAGLLVGYLWKALKARQHEAKEKDHSMELIKEGMCALLRDKLLQKLEKCASGGYCSVEARDDIDHMFVIYKALGGNGTIQALRERVFTLPVDKH
jgi:hypothetical protein